MGIYQEEKHYFMLDIERRNRSLLLVISEDGIGIGYLALKPEDEDLVPHVTKMIEEFNVKYTEKPPYVKTTGDATSSESTNK